MKNPILGESTIDATVYNDRVFDLTVEDILMDCCPDCTDILRHIVNDLIY